MNVLSILKLRLPDVQDDISDDLLLSFLESAKIAILTRRYPYNDFPSLKKEDGSIEYILEPKYFDLQIRMAMELISKMGAEGQESHSENGISRKWESGSGISESLLNEVIPKAGVL